MLFFSGSFPGLRIPYPLHNVHAELTSIWDSEEDFISTHLLVLPQAVYQRNAEDNKTCNERVRAETIKSVNLVFLEV